MVIAKLRDSLRGFTAGLPNLSDASPSTMSSFSIMYTVNQAHDSNNVVDWIAVGRWK